jgi:hypothetical protein
MKPTTIKALEAAQTAGKDGLPVKALHWKLRQKLVADGLLRLISRKGAKGAPAQEFVTITAKGSKELQKALVPA